MDERSRDLGGNETARIDILDEAGHVIFINSALGGLLHYRHDEVSRRKFLDRVAEDEREKTQRDVRTLLENEELASYGSSGCLSIKRTAYAVC
jgi:PAS domain S-box-containing protein